MVPAEEQVATCSPAHVKSPAAADASPDFDFAAYCNQLEEGVLDCGAVDETEVYYEYHSEEDERDAGQGFSDDDGSDDSELDLEPEANQAFLGAVGEYTSDEHKCMSMEGMDSTKDIDARMAIDDDEQEAIRQVLAFDQQGDCYMDHGIDHDAWDEQDCIELPDTPPSMHQDYIDLTMS